MVNMFYDKFMNILTVGDLVEDTDDIFSSSKLIIGLYLGSHYVLVNTITTLDKKAEDHYIEYDMNEQCFIWNISKQGA